MSESSNPSQPTGPLSIGNVVSAAIVLYRSRIKLYLGIALRASLWLLLPYLGLVLFPLLVINNQFNLAALGLIIPIWLILFIYGFTKYLMNSALISRLAFGELVNKIENVKSARQRLMPRQWSFLRVALEVGIYLIFIYLGLGIVGVFFLFLVFGLGAILGSVLNNSVVGGIVSGFLVFLSVLAFLFAFFWFVSRWIIAEVPLAVEENTNGSRSVGRSWELTQNSVFRIEIIVVIAFLVTLPIVGLANYLPQIILLRLEEGSIVYWLVYFISFVIGLGGNLFVLPFWQAIKAVLYYDLRLRREGIDLQIRDASQ